MQHFIKTLERLNRIDNLIKLQATGTPTELAEKLNISESHLYNLLNLMKDLHAPIYFDSTRNSYKYMYQVKFNEFIFEEV